MENQFIDKQKGKWVKELVEVSPETSRKIDELFTYRECLIKYWYIFDKFRPLIYDKIAK